MKRGVVVTGIGMATPAGTTREATWNRVREGHQVAGPIDRFDATSCSAGIAGLVDEEAFGKFPPRLLKRIDRFSRLAMAATMEALEDSGLDLEATDRQRAGAYLGNMYGGWEVADPSLRNLLTSGYQHVSPYVASAWFPTAPQGQISIYWQLKGYSKTIAADTASSALSIGYAARAIEEGRADVVVCGGAEAPVTPYALAFCERSGRLSPDGYRPFDRRSAGFQVGEGATILVLEALEHANARGASPRGEFGGFATGHVRASEAFSSAGSQRFARVLARTLEESRLQPSEIDYVGLDAQGSKSADRSEEEALVLVLGEQAGRPACTSAKPSTSHLLGAAAATEAAIGLLAMDRNEVPPIAGREEMDLPSRLRLVTSTASAEPIRTILIGARGADGTHAGLAFKNAS